MIVLETSNEKIVISDLNEYNILYTVVNYIRNGIFKVLGEFS